MLFNSYLFIFIYLPLVTFFYYLISKKTNKKTSILYLIIVSLIFYGYYIPSYTLLIIFSITVNFIIAFYINSQAKSKKIMFYLGLLFNITLLCFYKYTNFILENIGLIFNKPFQSKNILLPLAISFFSFQQIAFLSDVTQGKIKKIKFINYFLFIIFFPQLIAGPIVRYYDIIPQFLKNKSNKFYNRNFALGIFLFTLGLAKKVLIADQLSPFVDKVFDLSLISSNINPIEAGYAALFYSFQLYFDFSGYCDMAMGLAKIFNISLPLNFNSPYKAKNIIDFWRRWHITLSSFLTQYIFLPLNIVLARKSKNKIYQFQRIIPLSILLPITITFFISGLWHGAGWTFIVWGLIHGILVIINYIWVNFKKNIGFKYDKENFYIFFCRVITFISVTISFIFFRAENLPSAFNIIKSILRLFDLSFILSSNNFSTLSIEPVNQFLNIYTLALLILILIVNLLPNAQEITFSYFRYFNPYKKELKKYKYLYYIYKINPKHLSLLIFLVFVICLSQLININAYIYFNF